MIHTYTDASMDDPILSCGYLVEQSTENRERVIDAGCRVINMNSTDVSWCTNRAEYRALITGVRAALGYTDEPICLYTDSNTVVKAVADERWFGEAYFPHALKSFLGRFSDWEIQFITRYQNQRAHEQARVGLELTRDLLRKFDMGYDTAGHWERQVTTRDEFGSRVEPVVETPPAP